MKQLILFLFIGICSISSEVKDPKWRPTYLFVIEESGKFGYINEAGNVVIQPKFNHAGDFSEGLAAVRINGTYGYIDQTGKQVINPQFDYATEFHDGLALVYREGKPFYINKKGEKPFENQFAAVTEFKNGRALVMSKTRKFGFINREGKLIIDTAYQKIGPFINGLAVVLGKNYLAYDDPEKDLKEQLEIGVIDSLGRQIIPFGKYSEINDFSEGYFSFRDDHDFYYGLMDRNGKIVIKKPSTESHLPYSEKGAVHNQLLKIYVKKPSKKGISNDYDFYEAYLNLKGEILFENQQFKSLSLLDENRAFAKVEGESKYSLIDQTGKIIARDRFSDFAKLGFKNGVALAAIGGKWGLIDLKGAYLSDPCYKYISFPVDPNANYFFFTNKNIGNKSIYGISDYQGTILFEDILEGFDSEGFKNGLLQCVINGKLSYINQSGKIVWQQQEKKSMEQEYTEDIDYMKRASFYAYPSNPQKSNGWGASSNVAKTISDPTKFPEKTLNLQVEIKSKDTLNIQYQYAFISLSNQSGKPCLFDAQDSRLYMNVQAKDKNGEWKDIEYIPNSWCGNSYHTILLENNEYWNFYSTIPQGEFKTKLRIKLVQKSDRDENKEKIIYSNEYNGGINPAQFWRKEGYNATNLMDPYNE